MPTPSANPLIHPLDGRDPLELAARVASLPDPSLLEGGPGFGEAGRRSILAARPRLVFEATGSDWSLTGEGGTSEFGRGDPLDRLARLLSESHLTRPDEIPNLGSDPCPFRGGLIGFFGYDLAPWIERLPRRSPRSTRLPDLRFALHDTAVVVDHRTGIAELRLYDLLGEGDRALVARRNGWLDDLKQDPFTHSDEPGTVLRVFPAIPAEEYRLAVSRALEYIAAGDIFQVNLSQRFSAESFEGPIDPVAIRARARSLSPAPYSSFLRWDNQAILGVSPELFYETRGRTITTRPIKGTRPRGSTPTEDARLAAELAASPKDRAELTMIVDLERNDLGRVCDYGSVRVVDPGSVESYAQVHHRVATVSGRLRADVGPIDVVRAMFPGGSITGAPKIRAMEIIDELEPDRRGVYTGAVGYFGRDGVASFNIAIRTIVVEGNRAEYRVGGGIVADSDPEAEYRETLDKGRGLLRALEGEGGHR